LYLISSALERRVELAQQLAILAPDAHRYIKRHWQRRFFLFRLHAL
jgi:hypothetical protein